MNLPLLRERVTTARAALEKVRKLSSPKGPVPKDYASKVMIAYHEMELHFA